MRFVNVKHSLQIVILSAGLWLCPALVEALEATFDDLPLNSESYWNGSDYSGGFTSGGIYFPNAYFPPYDKYTEYWSGWSYSNTTDTATPGFGNQYSAIAAGGAGGSSNYAVGYGDSWNPATINLQGGCVVSGAYFTNTTYAFLAVRDGNDGNYEPFVRDKFGWWDENDDDDYDDPADYTGTYPDWFKLTIEGSLHNIVQGTVEFYLADYRFTDDYVIDEWTWVDLSSLGTVDKLSFSLSSSDASTYNGMTYMNTPAYFAMDNLSVLPVPEPSAIALLLGGLAALAWRWRRR